MTNELLNAEKLPLSRKGLPVYWSKRLHCWVVTGYEEISACLDNSRDLASNFYPWHLRALPADKRKDFQELNNLPAHVLTEQDGVYHDHIKAFITKEFNLRVKSFGKDLGGYFDEQLNVLGESFDFVEDFANPVSEKIMCDVIGFDSKIQHEIIEAATDLLIFLAFDATAPQAELVRRAARAKRSLAYLETLLEDEILCRLNAPRDDFISCLLHKERNFGDIGLSYQEIAYQILTLMIAGFITTENFLSLAAYRLLEDNRYRDLVGEPKQVSHYVNALLRIETPSTFVMRYARNPISVGKHRVQRGQFVLLHLYSANHDKLVFDSQCPFSKSSKNGNSLTFGRGDHICTGMTLARLVANSCFSFLAEKLPGLQLSGAPVILLDEFPVIRGVRQLPVISVSG